MQLCRSWEVNNWSDTQGIQPFYGSACCRSLSCTRSIQSIFSHYFSYTHFNMSLISTFSCSCWSLFFALFIKNLLVLLFVVMHATNSVNPTALDLSILIIFAYGYNLWSSLLSHFLQSPMISSLLLPNIFLSSQFWNTFSLCFLLMKDARFHTHTKLQAKI